MSIIDEQNKAFLQSLENDLRKEIAKIDEACKSVSKPQETEPILQSKPTLEELRKLRTNYLERSSPKKTKDSM
jgi:hypothetical protein